MDNLSSIFLGIVQGLTEFLPISSSGHLVLFQNFLGFREPKLLFDISLHAGTLLAVCIYFYADLKEMVKRTLEFSVGVGKGKRRLRDIHDDPFTSLTLWVLVGTVPTALIGLFFRRVIEGLFGSITIVGFMLIVTGAILTLSRFASKDENTSKKVGLLTALTIGVVQGLALIPGISRSGITIVCGLLFGLRKEMAARFSFLLSIPAIIGAMVLQFSSGGLRTIGVLPLTCGFVASAIIGLVALKILMGLVKRGKLVYFAPYCWAVGLFIIIV